MLLELNVFNYALIDQLNFQPGNGLSIITGETGAGKSILLGALGLVLGERAESTALRNPDKKCVVECTFDLSQLNLNHFFEENELDFENHTILRREITAGGKSRAFINDTPVNLQVLKNLGNFLVDIHSQHESIALFEKSHQLQMLDAFAGHSELISKYSNSYILLRSNEKTLENLIARQKQSTFDAEFRQFLLDELEEAALSENELPALEEELYTLENAEEVKNALGEAVFLLNTGESNAMDQIRSAVHRLNKIGRGDQLLTLKHRLDSLLSELLDISDALEKEQENTNLDPERTTWLQERIGLIYKLLKKHKLEDVSQLLDKQNELSESLYQESNVDERINQLQRSIEELREECYTLARQMHSNRLNIASSIENRVNNLLVTLSMPNADFKIFIEELKELNENGFDKVSFLFNANKGTLPLPLGKVVSGGELSRLMLVLKSIIAEKRQLPTLILDEIDSGISGEVAIATARLIENIAAGMQVVAITHLPQMASKGDCHFLVFKEDDKEKTTTKIKVLNREERLFEIAKMISGNEPGEIALANARELMGT